MEQQSIQTADLDVVANLSGLKVIDSLEVAQEFSKIPELGIDLSQVKLLANRIIPASPTELSQRQRWIESMDAGQKAQLWRNQQERNRLPQAIFESFASLPTRSRANRKLSRSIEPWRLRVSSTIYSLRKNRMLFSACQRLIELIDCDNCFMQNLDNGMQTN